VKGEGLVFNSALEKRGAAVFPLFFATQFFPQSNHFQPFTTLHPSPLLTTVYLLYFTIKKKEVRISGRGIWNTEGFRLFVSEVKGWVKGWTQDIQPFTSVERKKLYKQGFI